MIVDEKTGGFVHVSHKECKYNVDCEESIHDIISNGHRAFHIHQESKFIERRPTGVEH